VVRVNGETKREVKKPVVAAVHRKVERSGREGVIVSGRKGPKGDVRDHARRAEEYDESGAAPDKPVQPAYSYQSEGYMHEARVATEPTEAVEPVKAREPVYRDPRLPEIIADMLHDGLIIEKDNLDFLLSGTEFIINGEWQSEAVLGKYKKKYVPGNVGNGWTWSHSQHNPVPRVFPH